MPDQRSAARKTLLNLASALERRGYDDGPYVRNAIETLEQTRPLRITVELAIALGEMVRQHSHGSVAIWYDDADPENIWHVLIEDAELVDHVYLVNDETGHFTPSISPR